MEMSANVQEVVIDVVVGEITFQRVEASSFLLQKRTKIQRLQSGLLSKVIYF